MTDVERVIEQYRRIVHGEAWHGPALIEALAGVDAAGAAKRTDVCVHSIWQIVLHILHWQRAACRKIHGDLTPPTDDQNWVTVDDESVQAWLATLREVEESSDRFREVLSPLDDAALEKPIDGEPNSPYVLLHGVIEHTAYHIGQICLIKLALSGGAAPGEGLS